MALTQAQQSIVEKAQSVGGSRQGVALPDGACTYLVAMIASDSGLHRRRKHPGKGKIVGDAVRRRVVLVDVTETNGHTVNGRLEAIV